MITTATAPHRVNLDPRTKLLLLIMVNVLMFGFGAAWCLWCAVGLAAVLLVAAGKYRLVLKTAAFYAVLYAVDLIARMGPENVTLLWSAVTLPFFIFLPFVVYAQLIFATTSIGHAAASLQKLRLPSSLVIPILVMFRFVPTIGREFRAIRNAMRLRGAIGRGNPLKALEYLFVPLLFSLVKTGEELTLASLTRGLGLYTDRTHTVDSRMGRLDIAVLAVMAALMVASKRSLA